MFNSSVLDVAVGLVFTFLAVSLAVSAITESIATALKWRARTLLQSIKQLVNDPDFSGIALTIYNNALVSPREPGIAEGEKDFRNLPSYINPNDFASAFMEVAGMAKEAPASIKATIQARVPGAQLQSLLEGVVDRAAGDITRMRGDIASWFENSMDRVSGTYKRKTQICSFFVALVLVAGLNVSAIEVGRTLWLQPMIARRVAPKANLTAVQALDELREFEIPVGWSRTKLNSFQGWDGFEMMAGWLVTAVATLFGAPFWFDTLQRVVRLKGSGPSPAEKRSNTGAAA